MPRYFFNVFVGFKNKNANAWSYCVRFMLELIELKFRYSWELLDL